ncbi:MAG TPA: SurA N-terminal domain-containing protein [Gemmatimonadota bacterium]|nr:SurA N-terminal domain-containing protein [Gemmatimonadota bacterium]
MVMRAMRENTKWIMLILTVAFIGWLVLDWVQSRQQSTQTGANPVVGSVNGRQIHYVEWSRYLQNALDQARQGSTQPLTDEQVYRITQGAWDQMVNDILVQQELDRLGIRVSDAEIREAFRTSPPPSLRNHPAFQTNGQFDYQKYQAFFSRPGVDPNLLKQIEDYYRNVLPRSKLLQLVSQEVDVSDAELWQRYVDQNETARVRFVSLDPASVVPDSAVTVSDGEIQGYYDAHSDRFRRPATATVDLVTISEQPSAGDSAAARERADSLRSIVESGQRQFSEVVQTASADSTTGLQGGDLGWIHRGDLVGAADSAAFALRTGRVSRPVLAGSGYHLLRVDQRSGDSISVQHVLVPIQVMPEHEDRIFNEMDDLEGLALSQGLGAAADTMGLQIRRGVELTRGTQFVPGAGALGVAVDWAFDPGTAAGEVSQFFENDLGYHMVQLESRSPAGSAPLEAVRSRIRRQLMATKKRHLLRRRLDSLAAGARQRDEGLRALAGSQGWQVQESPAFTRTDFVPGLGRGTEAIGVAFGLPEGRLSGAMDAGENVALVEVVGRMEPDRATFQRAESRLRQQVVSQSQQGYLQQWLQALRDDAEVQDLRQEVSASRAAPTT